MANGFSFQTKVTSVFAALLAIVLLIAFALVYKVITDSTYRQIESQLSYSRNAVDHQLAARVDSLRESTQILARDFGFRRAVATGDIPTIKSVSDNFSTRSESSRIMVANLDGELLADTHITNADRGRSLLKNIRSAEEHGVAVGVLALDGTIYQFAIVPIQAPDPVGYLIAAKPLDIDFIRKLQSSLPGNIDISFLAPGSSTSMPLLTSTLTDNQSAALLPIVTNTTAQPNESFQATLDAISTTYWVCRTSMPATPKCRYEPFYNIHSPSPWRRMNHCT